MWEAATMARVFALVVPALFTICGSIRADEEGLFPFVVTYDAPANVTNVSSWLERPAGRTASSAPRTASSETMPARFASGPPTSASRAAFPLTNRPSGWRAAGPAGYQLRAYASHGQLLHLGKQPQQIDDRPAKAGTARLSRRPAQKARSLHEPEPARLAVVRRG